MGSAILIKNTVWSLRDYPLKEYKERNQPVQWEESPVSFEVGLPTLAFIQDKDHRFTLEPCWAAIGLIFFF